MTFVRFRDICLDVASLDATAVSQLVAAARPYYSEFTSLSNSGVIYVHVLELTAVGSNLSVGTKFSHNQGGGGTMALEFPISYFSVPSCTDTRTQPPPTTTTTASTATVLAIEDVPLYTSAMLGLFVGAFIMRKLMRMISSDR